MKKYLFTIVICTMCVTWLQAKNKLDNGLVAHYTFTGNANDESGFGNHGTVYGASLTTDRKGNANGAYHFNGTSDYIKVLSSPSLNISNEITLACWVKQTSVAECFEDILMKGSNSYGLQYSCMGGKPGIIGNISGWRAASTLETPELNTWYHIAGTFDGSELKIYLNGELKNNAVVAGSFAVNTDPLYIAYPTVGDNRYFEGDLDEICVYNYAMSDAEISQLYTGVSSSEVGLVAYYPMNGNANDASGMGNHGTVTGASFISDKDGNSNAAMSFNGADNYVTVPHSESLNITEAITMACWVKQSEVARCFEDILMKGSDAYGLQYTCNGAGWPSHIMNIGGWQNVGTGETPPLNTWYYITTTYDGTVEKIYINGVLKGSQAVAGLINANNQPLYLGFPTVGDNNYFKGSLDEVKIYNRALSETEVKILYNPLLGQNAIKSNSTFGMVYPNPVQNTLFISNAKLGSSIFIFNVNGKLILSKTLNNDNLAEIDVSNFEKGIYVSVLQFDDIKHFSKFVKH